MSNITQRLYIISGGPGSGKSTLIAALERHGYHRTIEAGRAIIQHQTAINGPGLPWADRLLFAQLMLSWEMRSYDMARTQSQDTSCVVFFDRGVPDIIGYLTLCSLPVPDYMHAAADRIRYNRTVFLAPPWQEIFTKDSERKQEFDEAERTFDAMYKTYTTLGYEIALLPKTSVEERVQFVLERIR